MFHYGTIVGCLFLIEDSYMTLTNDILVYLGFRALLDETGQFILIDEPDIKPHYDLVFILGTAIHDPVLTHVMKSVKSCGHMVSILLDAESIMYKAERITIATSKVPVTNGASMCAHDEHISYSFRLPSSLQIQPQTYLTLTSLQLHGIDRNSCNRILTGMFHLVRIELICSNSEQLDLQPAVERQLKYSKVLLYLSVPRLELSSYALSEALQRSNVVFYRHGYSIVDVIPRCAKRDMLQRLEQLPKYRMVSTKPQPPNYQFNNCWPMYQNKYIRIFWMWVCILKFIYSSRRLCEPQLVTSCIFPLIGGRFTKFNIEKVYMLAHRLKLI